MSPKKKSKAVVAEPVLQQDPLQEYRNMKERLEQEAVELRKRAGELLNDFTKAEKLIDNYKNIKDKAQREEEEKKVKDDILLRKTKNGNAGGAAKPKAKSAKNKKAAAPPPGEEKQEEFIRPDVAVAEVNHCLMLAQRKEEEAEMFQKKIAELQKAAEKIAANDIHLPYHTISPDMETPYMTLQTLEDGTLRLTSTYPGNVEEVDEEDFKPYARVLAKKWAKGDDTIRKDILKFLERAADVLAENQRTQLDIAPFTDEGGSSTQIVAEISVTRKGSVFLVSYSIHPANDAPTNRAPYWGPDLRMLPRPHWSKMHARFDSNVLIHDFSEPPPHVHEVQEENMEGKHEEEVEVKKTGEKAETENALQASGDETVTALQDIGELPPDEWANATLEAHNALRAKHGVPPLAWSKECFEFAAKQAAKMEQINSLDHDNMEGPSGSHGQNCFSGVGAEYTAVDAVKAWYDELTNPGYDFGQQGFSVGTGHFTQVVWKESRFVGMAKSANGCFIAANYLPPGNITGQFEKNVFPEGTTMQARADPKLGTLKTNEWSDDILRYLEGCPFADQFEPTVRQAFENGQTVVIERQAKDIKIKLVNKDGGWSSMGGPW